MVNPVKGINMVQPSASRRGHTYATYRPARAEDAACLYRNCRRSCGFSSPADFPLCDEHWLLLGAHAERFWHHARIKLKMDDHRARMAADDARRALLPKPTEYHHDPVVYYLRFGDRVKIGTSINLKKRLQALQYDALLAVEPGSYGLEKQRHEQFANDRLIGEWFSESAALQSHVRDVGSRHRIADLVKV
jgi:hypothetical protein